MKRILSVTLALALGVLGQPLNAAPKDKDKDGKGKGHGNAAAQSARGSGGNPSAGRARSNVPASANARVNRTPSTAQNRVPSNTYRPQQSNRSTATVERNAARAGVRQPVPAATARNYTAVQRERSGDSDRNRGSNVARRDSDRRDWDNDRNRNRDNDHRDWDRGNDRGWSRYRYYHAPSHAYRGWNHGNIYTWNNHRYRYYGNSWVIIDPGYAYTDNVVVETVRVTGDVVEDVQEELLRAGYNPGPVDGVLGGGTRTAIARFQADNGLPVTGRIDSRLLRSLGLS